MKTMIYTSNEKYAIIVVLSSLMKADGVIEPDEKEYLGKVTRRLGINIDDIPNISSMDIEDCRQIIKSMPEDKKNQVSKCFLDMVGVDGHVDLRELKVLHGLL